MDDREGVRGMDEREGAGGEGRRERWRDRWQTYRRMLLLKRL